MDTIAGHWPVLLDWLIRTTFQVSILILIIFAIRMVWPSRLPVAWRHLVWLILLVRMFMPWAPASRLSVFNWMPLLSEHTSQPISNLESPRGNIASSTPLPVGNFDNTTEDALPQNSVHPAETEHTGISLRGLLMTIWIAGAIAMFIAVMVANISMLFRVRNARLVTDPAVLDVLGDAMTCMGLQNVPALMQTDRVSSPILLGWLRPLLLLPEGMLEGFNREQLRHIFLHELAHMKRYDVVVAWLATILQMIHWFNPLVWLAFHRMRADRELACDALVLSRLKPDHPKAYAETIIELVQRYSQASRAPVLVGVFDSKTQLTRRIVMISRYRGSSKRWHVLGLAVLTLIGFVALTDAQSAPAERPMPKGEKATLEPTSKIDERGHIVDKIDYPFVHDPEIIGQWETVDFVPNIDDFDPKVRRFKGDFFLKGMAFLKGGRTVATGWTWTKGLILSMGDKTAGKYIIKTIGDSTYLFIEWKSGDYVIHHRKPPFYVLKKLSSDPGDPIKARRRFMPVPPGEQAELKPGASIGADGRIIDKIDYPFVNDPQVIGQWKSVDFIEKMKDFEPGKPKWKRSLFLKELVFLKNGRTFRPWLTWTKGMVFHSGDKTASEYHIKKINGTTYMFFEWKSGDYVILHRKPSYYVLKKITSDPGDQYKGWDRFPSDDEFRKELPAKVAKLDINKATLKDVIKVFGEPGQYLWGQDTFTKDNLPDRYICSYPTRFMVVMMNDRIVEIRFHEPGYTYLGKLTVGSTLDEVLAILGQPDKTIEGGGNEFEDGVLYKNLEGRENWSYYARKEKGVRLFFSDNKVSALYVTANRDE